MRVMRRGLAMMAVATATPATAQVYHLHDGVVRVRHGGGTVATLQPSGVRAKAPSGAQTVEIVQPEIVQPALAPAAVVAPAWDRTAAAPLLEQAAAQAGVHPALLEALVWQESRWRPGAVSRKGAVGLTQLMPGTARELGVDPHDPVANLNGGARHLRGLIDHFDGDLVKALAAYNAGVRRVEEAGGVPPIRETQSYVLAILGRVTATMRQR